eukprot:393438-Prymnesium_polylepis.1
MQAPAQPRLVACPTLAARLLELSHLHREEVLVDHHPSSQSLKAIESHCGGGKKSCCGLLAR